MTQQMLSIPLSANLVDGAVLITGPDGVESVMTIDAAKATLAQFQAALGAVDDAQEIYQKPVG
jgi:hypothetical protein